MTIDQEKMLCELIEKLEATRYADLLFLARDAYNRGIEDALELYRNPSEEDSYQDNFDRDLEKLKI